MRSRRALLVFALGIVVAVLAPVALAGWSSSLTAGPLPVSSATLAAPTAAAATTSACSKHDATTIQVAVSWTATSSAFASGYTIKRGTAVGGPFTTVGSVSGLATVTFTDTTGTLAISTNYYYVVVATFASWTSQNSNVATVLTPDTNCHGGT
jgi:hypothetical protein